VLGSPLAMNIEAAIQPSIQNGKKKPFFLATAPTFHYLCGY
jgi:hypothetical protein